MHRFFLFLPALLISFSLYAAEPETLIHEAAMGWMNAAVKQDSAALDKFLADDLQYAHASGTKQTKQEYVAAVTSGPARYESFTLSDLKITVYGTAAALTAYCDVKMVGQDSFRVRTLQLYTTNDNGQWQMSAHQSARMRGGAR
jgi:ketosteroid isomerase-like protein